MNSEALKIFKEPDEHLVFKHENGGNSNSIPGNPGILLNRIKIEDNRVDWDECDINGEEALKTKIVNEWQINTHSEQFEARETIEQVFIKNEDDQNTEGMSEVVLNSIKSEPSEVEWNEYDAHNKNFLKKKVDGLEMGMYCEVKEELIIKNERDEDTDAISETYLSRIKNEYSEVDNLPECPTSEYEHLSGIKSEMDMETEEFHGGQITEECIIKSESERGLDGISDTPSDSMAKSKFQKNYHQIDHLKVHNKNCVNPSMPSFKLHTCVQCHVKLRSKIALDKHLKEKHFNSVAPVSNKLYQCKKCIYITRTKDNYHKHMLKHPKTAGLIKLTTCTHCNATFKSELSHDDHVVRKHPDFIKSINKKLHVCTKCHYQTIIKSNFDKHVSIHSKTTPRNFSKCLYCDTKYKSKISLDDHVVKNHPNCITSVGRKIHACTECVYQTVQKTLLVRHMSTHSQLVSNHKRTKCIHCTATFKFKISLDDHVLRKHPKFISSVTRKLHKCTECTYKTTIKSNLSKHVSIHLVAASGHVCMYAQCNAIFRSQEALDDHAKKHSETAPGNELSKCIHCNATFKGEISLDDHVVRKHYNSTTSVTSKVHECTKCNYKTAVKSNFNKHMSIHLGTASKYKCTFTQCNAIFKSKDSLDDHVVKKHPLSVPLVARKIYECTECDYKTTLKYKLGNHMSVHPETGASCEISTCTHCNAIFKSKRALDDHVVRKHPKFITSLDREIYQCTECIYKTVFKYKFDRHMFAHPESGSS